MSKYIDTDDLRKVLDDLVEYLYILQTVTEKDTIIVDLLGSGKKIKLKVLEVKESKKDIRTKGEHA